MTTPLHMQKAPSGPGRQRTTLRRRRATARTAIAVIALASLIVPGIVALLAASVSAF